MIPSQILKQILEQVMNEENGNDTAQNLLNTTFDVATEEPSHVEPSEVTVKKETGKARSLEKV